MPLNVNNVIQLASIGLNVVLVSRSPSKLQATQQQMSKFNS